jgi:hypothetical protein
VLDDVVVYREPGEDDGLAAMEMGGMIQRYGNGWGGPADFSQWIAV